MAAQSEILRGRVEEHQGKVRTWQRERQEMERRKGEDFRRMARPLTEREIAARAQAFDAPIESLRERIQATRALLSEFRRQRRRLERGPEAAAARARLTEIVQGAQMARLELVRNAFLTLEGLEHTQLRPSAWWLPLVDPSGAWLDAMASGTKARLEPLA